MGITARLALTMVGLVLVTALVCSALIFSRLNTVLIEASSADLERETEIQATRFVSRVDELMRDTLLLANVPPVQGMVRAAVHGGSDPLDGTRYESWRERLQTIFVGAVRNKPDYLQIRFIGLANNGRELVRVGRARYSDSIEITEPPELQEKGGESYLLASKTLERREIHLSEINLNREFGEIELPKLPVLRTSTPIFDNRGEIFGVIVINFAVEAYLREFANVVDSEHTYFVTNERGEYLLHPQEAESFAFEFGSPRHAQDEVEVFQTIWTGDAPSATQILAEEQQVITARRVNYGPAEQNRWIGVIVADDFSDITLISRAVARQAGALILLLVVGAVVLGLWVSRALVSPVERLAEAVRDMDIAQGQLNVPEGLTDEAGELAKALEISFEALRRRTEELETNNKELEQFAYIASHDLQEPVRTITSFSSLLHKKYEAQLDVRGQKSLNFILDSCQRMQALIHGLLEYSRLGKQAEAQEVDLNELLQGVLQDLNASIEGKQARIHVGTLPRMRVMAVEVRLLFQNLIGNAIKFSRPDVAPLIRIEAKPRHRGWEFSVADNGLGIAPEHRQKVFMIFQRLQNRDAYEGTGIGLAHCRKVVEMHHGRIWIEDAPEGGTMFAFTLHDLNPSESRQGPTE